MKFSFYVKWRIAIRIIYARGPLMLSAKRSLIKQIVACVIIANLHNDEWRTSEVQAAAANRPMHAPVVFSAPILLNLYNKSSYLMIWWRVFSVPTWDFWNCHYFIDRYSGILSVRHWKFVELVVNIIGWSLIDKRLVTGARWTAMSGFPRSTRRMPMIEDDLKLPEECDGGRPSSTYGQSIIITAQRKNDIES